MPAPSSRIHSRGFLIQMCSLVLVLGFLGILVTPVLGAMMVFVDDAYQSAFLVCLGGTALLFLLFYIIAWNVRCKVCTNQLFAPRKCIRHSAVRAFFGSYSLWMALSALLVGYFRCQFCGEKTRVRERAGGKYKERKPYFPSGVRPTKAYRHAVRLKKDDNW